MSKKSKMSKTSQKQNFALRAKSNAKQSKAKQSKAMQSKAMPSNAM